MAFTICLLLIDAVLTSDPSILWWQVERIAGKGTVYSFGESPYTRVVPGMTLAQRVRFSAGAEEFSGEWQNHDRTSKRFGLGPSFNATSCSACHYRNGRGLTQIGPLKSDHFTVKASDTETEPKHLFSETTSAQSPAFQVKWEEFSVTLPDESVVAMRRPQGQDQAGRAVSLPIRNAPGVYGLGLLEAVDLIQVRDDPIRQAYKKHGVYGRVRHSEGAVKPDANIGRFGWKSEHANLESQVGHALLSEMGVTTKFVLANKSTETVELGDDAFRDLVQYMRLLGVPARRGVDSSDLQRGASLFAEIGCTMCHIPSLKTGHSTPIPEFRDQVIYPYSDMLLHDMGEGLADSKGPLARFWRTSPLWGIGVQHEVSPQAGYLHDGRARSLLEAVLWHGGEGLRSRQVFSELRVRDRTLLLQFLKSL